MNIISLIFSIILSLVGVLGIPLSIALLVDYVEHRSFMKAYPVLKFKSFLSFYDLNPDRWRLYSSWVSCKTINKKAKEKWGFEKTEYHEFCFNYIDTKRYEHWFKYLSKYKQSQYNAKQTALMLAAVKEDIASIEAISKQEHAEAINILRSIHNI